MNALEALLFDTFGTLVDWRTSLIDDLTAFGNERGLRVDWPSFVIAWRGEQKPAFERIARGEEPWANFDAINRASLERLAARFGFAAALDANARDWCVDRWHHLRPWPDTVTGLERLRKRFILGTLSNGSVRLLVDLARSAPLPVDLILSAETFRRYKRDPEVYRGASTMLATAPQRIMMVAAHNDDLHAAAAQGMRTAFILRPTEYGPDQQTNLAAEAGIDLAVRDVGELADRLEA
ncbi:MAG TPA: haloacid dehalogenase type II [Candidatus Acidoferrum sp.]|nr:haloacid dehalogenase type II [Candidatus Acidoferrum sp.]